MACRATRVCRPLLVFAALGGCGEGRGGGDAWDPGGLDPSGSTDDPPSSTSGIDDGDDEDDHEPDDGNDASDPDGMGETTDGGFDCTPWPTDWVGAPCTNDADCSYDGGFCIREDEGFPCGTCSQPCTMLCPDLDGAPQTFCVDGVDVGLQGGHCLSRCSPELLGGDGCRDGYDCTALTRFMSPGVTAGVCVPQGMWDPMSSCQETLMERGVAFAPTTHQPDHPAGHPNLACVIDDPVLLYGPVLGVGLTDGNGNMAPVLVSCATALAIADTAEIAANMQPIAATEMIHYGTYNCRVIAGTSTLSNHAEGRAIDLAAFVLADGTQITLLQHWEKGVAMPVTSSGRWLRGFADTLWSSMTWNIILTPEYDSAHADHFHVDLTPGGDFYQ